MTPSTPTRQARPLVPPLVMQTRHGMCELNAVADQNVSLALPWKYFIWRPAACALPRGSCTVKLRRLGAGCLHVCSL